MVMVSGDRLELAVGEAAECCMEIELAESLFICFTSSEKSFIATERPCKTGSRTDSGILVLFKEFTIGLPPSSVRYFDKPVLVSLGTSSLFPCVSRSDSDE